MKKTSMLVTESSALAEGIYSLTLQYGPEDMPEEVRPGQFAGIFPKDASMLLMRPISICRYIKKERSLRFVYRAAGKGTKSFTSLKPGDRADMLGILGNGYDTDLMAGKRVLLLGGGIGIPPMLELAVRLKEKEGTKVTAALGYRNSELFLKEEFEKYCHVLVATEDGSRGIKGNVLDAVRAAGISPDVICACGPSPMLRAVKAYAEETGALCFISLEERMACGVGACLGCVAPTVKKDAHSHVNNTRVCTEGPVFDAEYIAM
jgi:dihydroorotate dehydrogenase electron transfer subunit